MAAKCPGCGKKLKWYEFRAECKSCGVSIPNYNWEARLEEDADVAESAFARMHYYTKNFKSAVFGSRLRIVRLVCTLLPLVGLVVPLLNASFSFPFYEKTESISFLTFILDYLLEYDIGSAISLMSGEIMGAAFTALLLAILFAFLAVVAGVVNFFLVLVGAFHLRWLPNVILNVISLLSWGASAYCLYTFTNTASEMSMQLFSGTVSPWYLLGIGLFALDLVVDIVVGMGLKKQKAEQPNLEEAVRIELLELREKEQENAAEIG